LKDEALAEIAMHAAHHQRSLRQDARHAPRASRKRPKARSLLEAVKRGLEMPEKTCPSANRARISRQD